MTPWTWRNTWDPNHSYPNALSKHTTSGLLNFASELWSKATLFAVQDTHEASQCVPMLLHGAFHEHIHTYLVTWMNKGVINKGRCKRSAIHYSSSFCKPHGHDATDLAGNRCIQVCPSASKQPKPLYQSRGGRQHKEKHEMKPWHHDIMTHHIASWLFDDWFFCTDTRAAFGLGS